MHAVYSDLDLERNWQHPHVEGWMRLFERWAKQPAFERAWRISESTYAKRFRSFYRDRVRRSSLPLPASFVGFRYQEHSQGELDELLTGGSTVISLTVTQGHDGELMVTHGRLREDAGVSGISELCREPVRHCLKRLRMRSQLIVHIAEKGRETELYECLASERWRLRDYVVTSTDKESLLKFQEVAQNARLGLVVDATCDPAKLHADIESLKDDGIDFVVMKQADLNDARLECAKHSGLPLIVEGETGPRDPALVALFQHDCVAGLIAKPARLDSDDLPGFGRAQQRA